MKPVDVQASDIQRHIAQMRAIADDLYAAAFTDAFVAIPADAAKKLAEITKCWIKVTEAMWLGKGEEKH